MTGDTADRKVARLVAANCVAPTERRGRGAGVNPSGRYEALERENFDDGWWRDEPLAPFKTEVQEEQPRRIITTNQSPDISFDQSINPYRGCEHGCSYCYARPSHAYMGLSPGLDFETQLFAKPEAARLLRRELNARGYLPKTIALGTNTDPYQPIERRFAITREILEVFREYRHPVGIVTKSALVLRDLDILSELAESGLAKVALSVTTLDRKLAREMEPRASTPANRLRAIETLSQNGIPTSVMVAPIIPALNDAEIEAILERAYEAGAREAGYVLLRLPHEVKLLFREWLERYNPDRARRVLNLLRGMHGGRDYRSEWGVRQKGSGPYGEQIARRFRLACRRVGLAGKWPALRTDLFRVPERGGQLSLL